MTNETATPATRTRRNMDHSDCTHAATTDARTTCRESAKTAGTWPLPAPTNVAPVDVNVRVGNGKSVHATLCAGSVVCGAGRAAGLDIHPTDDAVTCGNCTKRMNAPEPTC